MVMPGTISGGTGRGVRGINLQKGVGGVDKLGVNFLAPLQHCYELLNLSNASLRFPNRLDSPKNSIPIRPIKGLEKRRGPWVRV